MRLFFFTLLISLFTFIGCSSTDMITLSHSDQELSVDGELSDWSLSESLIDESDSINYYATRTDEFLYLYIDVRGLGMNNAMRQSGFIIYLSNDEEQKKRVGIGYPTGTFNLLRENPAEFQSFLRDEDWSNDPGNRQMLEDFESEIFDRPMIVERSPRGDDPQYGFISKDRLEVDGLRVAANADRRLTGIEIRIPLDGSPIYEITGDEDIWLGFEIAPPDFRLSSDYDATQRNQYGSNRGGRMNQGQDRSRSRQNLRRQLGQYEQWYILSP